MIVGHCCCTASAAAAGPAPCPQRRSWQTQHLGACHPTLQHISIPQAGRSSRHSRPLASRSIAAGAANGAQLPPGGQQQQQQPALPPYAAWPATARVALRTGAYITLLGLCVLLLPGSVFGAVFDARCACCAQRGVVEDMLPAAVGL